MRILWHHAWQIIESYEGGVPLHFFLKGYYRQHPKLGSRDRRALSDMCYAWYRCSKALDAGMDGERKMMACLYLCGLRPKALHSSFPAHREASIHAPAN